MSLSSYVYLFFFTAKSFFSRIKSIPSSQIKSPSLIGSVQIFLSYLLISNLSLHLVSGQTTKIHKTNDLLRYLRKHSSWVYLLIFPRRVVPTARFLLYSVQRLCCIR